MLEKTNLEKAVELLRERIPSLIAVYQYGSIALGLGRADSDIDLGVLSDAPLDNDLRMDLQMSLPDLLGREVDLVDLIRASPVLLMQVLQGNVLFCANPRKLAEFENLAMSRYCQLNEDRADILRDIVARGSIYAR